MDYVECLASMCKNMYTCTHTYTYAHQKSIDQYHKAFEILHLRMLFSNKTSILLKEAFHEGSRTSQNERIPGIFTLPSL